MSKISAAEQIAMITRFLNDNYVFKYNEVRDVVEFKTLHPELSEVLKNTEFEPLTPEAQNSIILEVISSGLEGSGTKGLVNTIIHSKATESYNPFTEYLGLLPEWDGKDRVSDLFRCLPGITDEQLDYARRWMRSVVAHWLGMDRIFGNQTVLLLIGDQGVQKGSFIKNLLPEHLRLYYLDHINLTNKHDTDMALANCGLVNLDEFDKYTSSQQAELKYVITKGEVNARKIYGGSITLRKRMASFTATTNIPRPLKDKSGTRRFLSFFIPKATPIQVPTLEYDQLYAQVVHEVRDEQMPYWFTQAENERIQILNKPYCETDDLTVMISDCFRKPAEGEESISMSSSEILAAVSMKYPDVEVNRKNQSILGANLSAMGITSRRTSKGNLYDVVKIAA